MTNIHEHNFCDQSIEDVVTDDRNMDLIKLEIEMDSHSIYLHKDDIIALAKHFGISAVDAN